MVADVHRTLVYGGIFMYPATSEAPNGKVGNKIRWDQKKEREGEEDWSRGRGGEGRRGWVDRGQRIKPYV